jgi:hypothetical protein
MTFSLLASGHAELPRLTRAMATAKPDTPPPR